MIEGDGSHVGSPRMREIIVNHLIIRSYEKEGYERRNIIMRSINQHPRSNGIFPTIYLSILQITMISIFTHERFLHF